MNPLMTNKPKDGKGDSTPAFSTAKAGIGGIMKQQEGA